MGFVDPPGFQGSLYGGLLTCEQFPTWPLDSLALTNDFSSSMPLSGTPEVELPSFQNQEAEITCPYTPQLETVDSYLQSPVAANSCLLEAVLPEGLRGTQKRTWGDLVESSSLNHIDARLGDHGGPINPLDHTFDFGFSGTPPFSTSSSNDPSSQATSGGSELTVANSKAMPTPNLDELDGPANRGLFQPDALLGSDCFDVSYGGAKDRFMLNDVIQSLLVQSATSSTSAQWFADESSPSINMPPFN